MELAVVDSIGAPIQFVWVIPHDSDEQVGFVNVLARLTSMNPLKSSEVLLDEKPVTTYESAFYSWGTNADYFLHFKLSDSHLDTGFHSIRLTVTDDQGNQNSRPFSIKLTRNLPDDFYAPETVKVVEGWNLISAGKYPAWGPSTASIPTGARLSPYFEYIGGVYRATDAITPQKGVWVKAHAGRLIFNPRSISGNVTPSTKQGLPPSPPQGE